MRAPGDADPAFRVLAAGAEPRRPQYVIRAPAAQPRHPATPRAGDELAAEAEAEREHEEVKRVLARLERLEASSDEFDEAVRALIADVRHHVDEDERELLPRLREACGNDELAALAQRLRQGKSRAPVSPSLEGAGAAADKSKEQLYQQAQDLDVPGRSGMSKQELADEVSRRQ